MANSPRGLDRHVEVRSGEYDPHYDPLTKPNPGCDQQYAPTYWLASAGPPPKDDGPILQDLDTDVVIIGAGYTGLSCAIHLAKEHGIKAVVLEANKVAWGCSTRNGGQVQLSTGRLAHSQWIKRWGVETAKKMHHEMVQAYELFEDLIDAGDFDCDPQTGGHYSIAHKPAAMSDIRSESKVLNEVFGVPAKVLSRAQLHETTVKDQEAAGALYEPHGMSIHAGKLAFGYLELARKLGVKVHPGSPVLDWVSKGGHHRLSTPGGIVRCRSVALATGGYTSQGLSSLTKNKLMPILSNSVVTRKLTSQEQEVCGFKTGAPLVDTRTLRHYYRYLPDGRVQIGSRSAVTGADAENPKHLKLLVKGLCKKFPVLTDIEIDYSWWGWVDVAHDMMPRIVQPDPDKSIYYAMGYGGNGVMYSAQAGRRMAQMVAGKGYGLDLPIFSSNLPSYGILSPFRRLGQRMIYAWHSSMD